MLNRRHILGIPFSTLALPRFLSRSHAQQNAPWKLATFLVDVTCPIGHPCMGGGIANAKSVTDPLQCRGIILQGGNLEKPVVIASIDWCEIRNDAYDDFRISIARAASTTPERVLLTAIHQHDTPIADTHAEELLKKYPGPGSVCMQDFFQKTIQKVADSVSTARFSSVNSYGTAQARVEGVASNRRFLLPDGKPSFSRTSATRDEYARSQPENLIDPYLKTLTFWNNDKPLASLSFYAVHPMSYYGQGEVSWDFPGIARQTRQAETPDCLQIYISGCSGNVTAGKFNDGNRANRKTLADRLSSAMKTAFDQQVKTPLTNANFRNQPFRLEPRSSPGFKRDDLTKTLTTSSNPWQRCLAAMGLSWLRRAENPNHKIDLPCLDLGHAAIILLPGESYIEYQLYAQTVRPNDFICVAGYGESATGYVPTEKAILENDTNLTDWCWVDPGCEQRMKTAIKSVLNPNTTN